MGQADFAPLPWEGKTQAKEGLILKSFKALVLPYERITLEFVLEYLQNR